VASHDAYEWTALVLGGAGILTVAGGVFGYLGRGRAARRAQAEAFYVITELEGQPNAPLDERSVHYVLINGSDRIVTELILRRPDDGADPVGVVEPGRHVREIGPGQDVTGLLYWPHPVACDFRDTHGRRWLRDDRGRLYRVRPWTALRFAGRKRVMAVVLAWRRRRLPKTQAAPQQVP
jgi:hypothetical protein